MLMLIIANSYRSKTISDNFNTSHVNVNHLDMVLKDMNKKNFNTSHVNVNLHKYREVLSLYHHFNTSHVNVNRYNKAGYDCNKQISIHLMLMLISCMEWLQSEAE